MRGLACLPLACLPLCGCFGFGASRLNEDQLGYSRALSNSENRETLLNVVRLRYADAPSFLEVTQVISGYQLQRNVSAGFQVFPTTALNTLLSGGGFVQVQETPTFTFQPVTGEQFAQSFVRPLSPAELLPFALGGLPIDVLFRLGVQSVNGLQNTVPLTLSGSVGSPDFFLLLKRLRALQVAGLIGVRLDPDPVESGKAPGAHASRVTGHVYLSFTATDDPRLASAEGDAKRLLGMPPGGEESEVVYGRTARHSGQIALLTRSMLGVLSQLAFEVEVPAADVAQGRTMLTKRELDGRQQPVVAIHSGKSVPPDAFTAIQYRDTWFWVADDDFDSKLAFSAVQILLALAKTINPPGTVVTIPAG